MASPGPADPAAFSRALDEAAAHVRADRLDAAAQIYRRLEREAPADVRPAYSLAVIDIHQGRLQRARDRLAAVVAQEPRMAAAQHNLGAVSQSLGDWSAAAEAYSRALELNPAAGETRVGLAMALAALGHSAEAVAQNRALAADPSHRWPALTRIALIDAGAIGDDDLAAMQAAASDETNPAAHRVGLWFALGESLDRRGRDAEAFEAYAHGNRLQRAALDVAAAAQANAQAAAYVTVTVTARFVAEHAGQGGNSAAPIFVLGMPRSGSTLVEQILASHPQVQGLGETGLLPQLLERGYPKTAAGLRDAATRYLDGLRARGWDGASRVVDKTLENYLHAGLIGVLFPRAVIVHVVRDPIDNGFACYRQLFAQGNETLYDLADIAAEYVRYRSLMETWAARLPGRIVDIGYEALVADPETESRRLLTEVGLAWDPAVLRFHERKAAIQTASASQVRQPIYATSVQRWRRHAERLAPLVAALGSYADI
ncbi:tetratricopeptide repeat-containing sulfotransferase family protein [Phenylobacterium sp.]|uniref:tetratricopeptide repeat-containing sulfotransferase family protein n=1 Tax=Phenylobacterium sp. TaxID=1871053 RepID=UPI0025F6206B|nr:tetratricopeptide repeat-containing sulfotransferase family protein [Phenylobacterium sp.]